MGYGAVTMSVPVNPSEVLISSEHQNSFGLKSDLLCHVDCFDSFVLSFQCNVTLHADT